MHVALKDKPNKETELQWLEKNVFEHSGFHIEGEFQLLENTKSIPKFQSTKEVSDKIKKIYIRMQK